MTDEEKLLQEQLAKQRRDINRNDMVGYCKCQVEIDTLVKLIMVINYPDEDDVAAAG